MEIWRDIPEYEGLYQVSNLGRVKSIPHKYINNGIEMMTIGMIRKLIPHKGYYKINLKKGKTNRTWSVHQLVARAFLPNPNNHKAINHKDGNGQNNRLNNIEWLDRRSNTTHGWANRKTSGRLTGAYLDKNGGAWFSRICINNKGIHLGRFSTEIEAHEAYMKALNKYNITNKYVVTP